MNINKLEYIYIEGFKYFFNSIINLKKYDEKIDNSNLYFGKTKSININFNSNYYSLLNKFNVSKLTEEEQNIIINKKSIDEELIEIVKNTYKNILKSDNGDANIYGTPPSLISKNGNIDFEFVTGKNIQKFEGEEFIQLSKKQHEFISNINEMLKEEIKEKLNIECTIFVDKRV